MLDYLDGRCNSQSHPRFQYNAGQFWNIPVGITPFTGKNVYGKTMNNAFTVNLSTRGKDRSYVGFLYHLTWEFHEGPCLYVGDGQSGSIYEIENPNDGVIEGTYMDYIVSEGFVDDFKFGLFDKERCLL